MRFLRLAEELRVGLGADEGAKRPPATGRLPELVRQREERLRVAELAARPGDGRLDDVPEQEVVEHRDEVGEGLVVGVHVPVGGDREHRSYPVHDRMRDLVGDDVDRQAREHELPRQVGLGVGLIGAVVAEEDGPPFRVEVGVAPVEGVGHEPESFVAAPPEAPAGEPLEALDDAHGHRVHDLLVRARVALRGPKSLLGEHGRIVEVDRLVPAVAGRVVVDDLHEVAVGTRLQVVLERDVDREELPAQARRHRVEREGTEDSSFRGPDRGNVLAEEHRGPPLARAGVIRSAPRSPDRRSCEPSVPEPARLGGRDAACSVEPNLALRMPRRISALPERVPLPPAYD